MMEHWNTGEFKIQIENSNFKTNPNPNIQNLRFEI